MPSLIRLFRFTVAALSLQACLLDRVPAHVKDSVPPASGRHEELAAALKAHVGVLAGDIGPRSYLTPQRLTRAADYVAAQLRQFEKSPHNTVREWPYHVRQLPASRTHRCTPIACAPELKTAAEVNAKLTEIEFRNIDLEVRGTLHPEEVIVIGAHYDSDGCESGGCNPGADDNASGVAAIIELARMLQAHPPARTVRFVAFTNEEEPFFHTPDMGSVRYAKQSARAGDQIQAMLSIETIGYYSDAPDSQQVPWLLGALFDLPSVGNFITFVGNWDSEDLVHQSVAAFQRREAFPAEGLSTYAWVEGVDWSDHWAYWNLGVPAVMVTDTAPNRNLCYHKPCDNIDQLDFDRMSRVVSGLSAVIEELAN